MPISPAPVPVVHWVWSNFRQVYVAGAGITEATFTDTAITAGIRGVFLAPIHRRYDCVGVLKG